MFFVDPHVHTVASGHHTADRLIDVAKAAALRGLKAVGISEHTAAMTGGCTDSGLRSLLLSPRERAGVSILFGAETNILDEAGSVDLSPALYRKLDYVIASFHKECFKGSELLRNTRAAVAVMESGNCDILGHPADLAFPLDLPAVVRTAKRTGVLLELNEASVREKGYRGDNREDSRRLLALCKEAGVRVVLGSDSHGKNFVGDFSACEKLLKEVNFPDVLLVNHDEKEFLAALPRNRRK